ncbi:hypothetical protein DT075_19175 [Bacillus licheniformis]|nr:hypothetical protein DT075_19175 [Bacillus licheniformis]
MLPSFLMAFYAFSLMRTLSSTADKTRSKPPKKLIFQPNAPLSTSDLAKNGMISAFLQNLKR